VYLCKYIYTIHKGRTVKKAAQVLSVRDTRLLSPDAQPVLSQLCLSCAAETAFLTIRGGCYEMLGFTVTLFNLPLLYEV